MIRRKYGRRSLKALKQIHCRIVVAGVNGDIPSLRHLLLSLLVSLRFPCFINYARKLFDQITEPDIFMWNTMIRGFAHSSNPFDAIVLYCRMVERLVKPDGFTFIFLLKACTRLSSPFGGAQFHGIVTRLGFDSDAFVRNALINLHANCGDMAVATALFDFSASGDVVACSSIIAGHARRGQLAVARHLFDEFPQRDLVSWNVMITAYAKQGKMTVARELLDRAPARDVVSWNAVLAGYVQCRLHGRALELFREMQRVGVQPDEATMVSLLSSCAGSGDLESGKKIHSMILTGNASTVLLSNSLIDMYAKCGSIEGAMGVFRPMREKDVWTWNSIIGGLAIHGRAGECANFFEEMRRVGARPNEITFLGLLVACSHHGDVEQGRRYFSVMSDSFGLEPGVKHHGCMVDMLGRMGFLEEALELVVGMKMKPNEIIWRTLLGACRMHGNVELARRVGEELMKMGWDESNDYVLLSNTFASIGYWRGVEELRRLMDDKGLRKEAACSLVDP